MSDNLGLELATRFQMFGASFFKSYQHEMKMAEIVRDGRSKAKHRRRAIKWQKKAAECYASARNTMTWAAR